MEFYSYQRVSTTKQDVLRQEESIKKYCKDNNIIIKKENNFVDYFTGKTFNRENYIKLKRILKNGDYIIIKEVDRFGRDWDEIKREWQELKDNGINIIIIDTPILSDPLPSEQEIIKGLDSRLIKEQVLSLLCYMAQKEREKISQRTKEALKALKNNGKTLGRPSGEYTTKENFIYTLELVVNGSSIDKAVAKTLLPRSTFKLWLKQYKQKYDIYNNIKILETLKKEEQTTNEENN